MTTLGRIITGESATPEGRQAVFNVIMNRARTNFGGFGPTWFAQATAPRQFSCYPSALGPEDATTEAMILAAESGQVGNIVPLSFNYANPSIMNRAATPDSWVWKALAAGGGVEIGGNTFWASDQGGSPGYDPSKLWKGPPVVDASSPAPAPSAPAPAAPPSQIQTVAGQIAADIDTFSKFEPEIAAVAGFIPGASSVVAIIQPLAPTILAFASRALHDIASANGGDIASAVIELMQHLTKGQPNSTTLTNS